jgi:pimeloyl-ACP methyl ester carboxylesterase
MRGGGTAATLASTTPIRKGRVEMAHVSANDVELFYELTGRGDPLVLVHGSWSDHGNWQAVEPDLAESFLVAAYDRRDHGRSERTGRGTRRDQEDDLAALIDALEIAPVHIAGTSFGATIAIGLAARRPELVRSVIAHEPPLISLVAHDPEVQPLLAEVQVALESVLARLARGDTECGARRFVEEVALGPGAWEQLPMPQRETMIESAPAFVVEQRDANFASADPDELSRLRCPVLLTQGDQSPAWFRGIVGNLAEIIEAAEIRTYHGAGHAPHVTHPDDYLEAVTDFLARSREPMLLR